MLQKKFAQICFVYIHFHVDRRILKNFHSISQCFLFCGQLQSVVISTSLMRSIDRKRTSFGSFLQLFFCSITVTVPLFSFCGTLLGCRVFRCLIFATFFQAKFVIFQTFFLLLLRRCLFSVSPKSFAQNAIIITLSNLPTGTFLSSTEFPPMLQSALIFLEQFSIHFSAFTSLLPCVYTYPAQK